METLTLQGVRCFGARQDLPIRPVTLLVGENSTGKSTVLAMVRAAWDLAYRRAEPDFNEEPFDLGGYEAIAHHGGPGKRADRFLIEASFEARPGSARQRVGATFIERAGQPFLVQWEVERGDHRLRVTDEGNAFRMRVQRGGRVVLDKGGLELQYGENLGDLLAFGLLPQLGSTLLAGAPELVIELSSEVVPGGLRPIASAPIRSKPIRTYDPKRETREPEGSHVPMELATLHATNPDEFEDLTKQLASYGEDANLFSKLQVKRLGKKAGDPFQIQVAVDRNPFNLRDVGYGVSQVLPILVDTLTAPKHQTFLLQQPEVHLHPRAQAALGSLLVEQATRRGHTFVVETHSDYLVDRVRQEVARAKVSKDDVVILFFDRQGADTTVHPLQLDAQGNVLDAPSSYRQFFLEEELALLTRTSAAPPPSAPAPVTKARPRGAKVKRKPAARRSG